jgi:uncharacterized protein (DUF58 family)
MRPTPLGVTLAAAGFVVALLPTVGLPRAWPALPLFWGVLILCLGVDALLLPRRRRLGWDVEVPDTLYIGERDRLTLTARLERARSVPVEARLDLSDDLEPQPTLRQRFEDGSASFRFDLVPRKRGTAKAEVLWLRYRGPLGLWYRVVTAPLDRDIRVLPNLLLVRQTALRFFADKSFRAGLKIERYKGDGTEFESLKEYLVGDDNRAIDWKASARHRKLLVRQFRAERNHQILLTVDTGHLMAEPIDGIPKLDHALNAALVLAYVCLTNGDRVGLYTFDSKVGPSLEPAGGTRTMRALTEMTAGIRYSEDETHFTLGLTSLAQKVRRRSLVILLTDFVDTVTAELMLENLDRIGRRHLVVFVSIRDPLLGRISGGRPVSENALHRSVVAHTFLRDREVVHRRLRRMGVFPLDAEPGRIGPELINQYLDIKRRERV